MAYISILLPDLRGGGVERIRIDLAYEFSKSGHCVEFVLMRRTGEFLEEAEKSFSVVDLRASRIRNVPLPLSQYLSDRQPYALLVAMWPLTAIAPVVARFSGFHGRILVSEHCRLDQQYPGLVDRMLIGISSFVGYRLSHVIVAVSDGVGQNIASMSAISKDRIFTIYNSIRSLCSPKLTELKKVNKIWGRGTPRILTVGSLKDQKNHALLLRAFARLPFPDARLMLLGQGDLEDSLRSLAEKLGISDRVIFAGFHNNPAPFYATADLFVLSSDYEGFGNVIVEALSFGLPVVSTDCPSGPAEILEGGRLGRLVPVGDVVALSRAIEEALAAPVDPQMLRARAADFAPEKVARQYLEVLGL